MIRWFKSLFARKEPRCCRSCVFWKNLDDAIGECAMRSGPERVTDGHFSCGIYKNSFAEPRADVR